MTFSVILGVTIPVFLIIGVGCLCRVVGLVTESSEKTIMALALNVLYPCFIISEVCGNQTLQQVSVVVTALLTGLTLTAIALAVAAAVGKLLKLKSGPEQNTFTVSGAIQNYGFIPIPLLKGLFPEETETVGLLFIHNLGLELALWTVGVVIISGTREGMWRRLINGPTVAIILGLFLNFTSGHELIPEVAKKAMEQLGLCTIPISLLLVGVSLAGVVIKGNWLSGWRIPVGCDHVTVFDNACFLFVGGIAAVKLLTALDVNHVDRIGDAGGGVSDRDRETFWRQAWSRRSNRDFYDGGEPDFDTCDFDVGDLAVRGDCFLNRFGDSNFRDSNFESCLVMSNGESTRWC